MLREKTPKIIVEENGDNFYTLSYDFIFVTKFFTLKKKDGAYEVIRSREGKMEKTRYDLIPDFISRNISELNER